MGLFPEIQWWLGTLPTTAHFFLSFEQNEAFMRPSQQRHLLEWRWYSWNFSVLNSLAVLSLYNSASSLCWPDVAIILDSWNIPPWTLHLSTAHCVALESAVCSERLCGYNSLMKNETAHKKAHLIYVLCPPLSHAEPEPTLFESGIKVWERGIRPPDVDVMNPCLQKICS